MKAGDGRSPQSSSSSPRPNTEKDSVFSVKKDSASCDLQHCSGHGNCITEGKVTRCQCAAGYKGEFCQEKEAERSHAGVILGVFCLVAALMAAAFIFAKRYWPWVGCVLHLGQRGALGMRWAEMPIYFCCSILCDPERKLNIKVSCCSLWFELKPKVTVGPLWHITFVTYV